MKNIPFHRFNPLVPLSLSAPLYNMCGSKAAQEARKQQRDKAAGRVSAIKPIKATR